MSGEVFAQRKSGRLFQESSPYKVEQVLDWCIFDNYYVIITEYDEKFQSLYDCTLNQIDEHFSEKECKDIFKVLSKTIYLLNKNIIFHLDLKASIFLFNTSKKELKLRGFLDSTNNKTGTNPLIQHDCGTEDLLTP